MHYPPAVLDEIRARLPVSKLVSRTVKLTKKGREYAGLSPFKSEKTPSFFVNDAKNFYHCFASGEHGDIFTFLMKTEGLPFRDAVQRLASESGVALPASPAEKSVKPKTDLRSHCPNCGPDRKAYIRGQHQQSSTDEFENGRYIVEFVETYRILECAGCETLYCQRTVWCSEADPHDPNGGADLTYWPSTTQWQPPKWMDHKIDGNLHRILTEVYTAFNSNMPILAAIGVRTAFDRASELLGIDTEISFKQKLQKLQAKGMISGNDNAALSALIDAGSAAAHRGWQPSERDLSTMVQILEAFVHKEIVLSVEIGGLVSAIPKRQSKS